MHKRIYTASKLKRAQKDSLSIRSLKPIQKAPSVEEMKRWVLGLDSYPNEVQRTEEGPQK